MKQLLIIALFISLFFSCKKQVLENNDQDDLTTFLTTEHVVQTSFDFYSKPVKDTFKIFICGNKDDFREVYVFKKNSGKWQRKTKYRFFAE
jgi:hypothetical protein